MPILSDLSENVRMHLHDYSISGGVIKSIFSVENPQSLPNTFLSYMVMVV